jgi:hypothetical protein
MSRSAFARVGEDYRPHRELGARDGALAKGNCQRCNTPCRGMLKWSDMNRPVPMVKCNRCGYETGVRE